MFGRKINIDREEVVEILIKETNQWGRENGFIVGAEFGLNETQDIR